MLVAAVVIYLEGRISHARLTRRADASGGMDWITHVSSNPSVTRHCRRRWATSHFAAVH